MDEKQLEAFERNLACPCPCTLDIYTCRTTDFNCGISPAVHGDIQRLVDGGYGADEIMAAMTQTYGDFILMQPRKQGFNLLAWFAPFAAIALGAVAIGALLRGWRRNADVAAAKRAAEPVTPDAPIDATPDELARLQAALREER
jgi:cytochrome c-type biogenesis protein CcmH